METPLNLKAERVIRVAKPSITDKEIRAVHDCLISGQISAGPLVEQFEHDFAALHDRKYGVTCNSGTSALTLALLAIGAESVVMPTMTMVACANAALSAGCTPKFVDHGKWNVKADCYLPVHLYGVPDETINYSLSHVVEDCAEAHFGKFQNGQSVGSRGKLACFSLFANKIITCFPAKTTILVRGEGKGKSRIRNIEDIQVGQLVLSYNTETSTKEYKKVIATQQHETSEPLSVVDFSNGNQVTMTSDHPVYIINKGWVPAKQLQVGDQAIQYIYRGLRNAEARGKSYEEQFGPDVAKAKAEKQAKSLSEAHLTGKFCTHKYKSSRKDCWRFRKTRTGGGNGCRQRVSHSNPFLLLRRHMIAKAKFNDEAFREAFVARCREVNSTPEHRKKISDGVLRAMKNESYWTAYFKGLSAKKNKAEAKLESILDEAIPGEFAFNGDCSQGIRIGNYIPDFVPTGEKRKVIELFGTRWHTQDELEHKQAFYLENGYESLFIWDTELRDTESVKSRVTEFAFNPNVKIVEVVSVTEKPFTGTVYNITVEDNHNYFTKGILVHNCGEGGIVLTDDWDMAERLKSLRAHAFTKGEHFHHKEFALGVRMTEIQAAFGLAQLERKNTIVNTRRRLAESILAQLSSVWWLEFMPRPTGSAWWVVPILVRKESPYTKDDVRAHLARNGVETRSFFKPMHQQPHLELYASGKYPIADDLSKRGFYLPLHPELSSEDIDFMCGLLRDMK